MIEVNAISKQFGKLEILKKVTMSLPAGECIALIGPNGCGKTTLIKCILGMVLPTSGTILFEGKPIDNEYLYRNKIGYMPQMGRYPDNMTIGQIIKMMKEIRKEEKTLDEELYEQYGLSKLLNKKMRTLSGGTIQKVSATLAFMFNPAVYILDEPTAGLDPIASEILKEKIIKEKEKGKLFLITSHLLSELDDLVTQLIFMQEG
ncbi:MAG TPA: ABC transporter ATP-binding protein, partial [Chitinophagaceae bacterium]|nr:ABC transporter ATP-binding protein [Chitinophagaceae bacterium]